MYQLVVNITVTKPYKNSSRNYFPNKDLSQASNKNKYLNKTNEFDIEFVRDRYIGGLILQKLKIYKRS